MIAMLASNSINLLPDKTVFPQLVVYLTVFYVLNRWVIQPSLKVLARRHELTKASEAQSAEKQTEIAKLHETIEGALKAERQQILLREEEKRKAVEAELRARLEQTRKQSQDFIAAERAKLQTEAERVEAELVAQVPALKKEIIENVTRFEEVAS